MPFCACVCPYAHAYALVKTRLKVHDKIEISQGLHISNAKVPFISTLFNFSLFFPNYTFLTICFFIIMGFVTNYVIRSTIKSPGLIFLQVNKRNTNIFIIKTNLISTIDLCKFKFCFLPRELSQNLGQIMSTLLCHYVILFWALERNARLAAI